MNAEQLSHEAKIDASLRRLIQAQPGERRNLQTEFYALMSQRTPDVVAEMESARMERVGL